MGCSLNLFNVFLRRELMGFFLQIEKYIMVTNPKSNKPAEKFALPREALSPLLFILKVSLRRKHPIQILILTPFLPVESHNNPVHNNQSQSNANFNYISSKLNPAALTRKALRVELLSFRCSNLRVKTSF